MAGDPCPPPGWPRGYGLDVPGVWLSGVSGPTANAARTPKTGTSHSGAARTKSYGVDAAFMSFELHERGIHIV